MHTECVVYSYLADSNEEKGRVGRAPGMSRVAAGDRFAPIDASDTDSPSRNCRGAYAKNWAPQILMFGTEVEP